MKYEFIEINNFIVTNISAEHYEADLKLYRKLFPDSGILKDLENPFPPKKKELDERMLFEILNADRICMETIMENRGIMMIPEKGKEIKLPGLPDPFVTKLMEIDLETLKYNEAKTLVFGLKLTTADQKTVTLIAALRELKENLLKVTIEAVNTDKLPAGDLNPEIPNVDELPEGDVNTDAPNVDELPEGEKKS